MESEGRQDHLYVAHYDEPDEPDPLDAEDARRDAQALAQAERDSARQLDFARRRVPRYIAGFFLACVSIAGGAVAVMAVIAAVSPGTGPVELVTGIDANGNSVSVTLTSGQMLLFAGALVALEVVLVWAATLLFSKGLHPRQWVAVGVMAAASTAGIVLGAGGILDSASNWPYVVAFPLIVVAALLESLRIRRLRARWGE
ncbi:MAG: hypothetical protein NTX16_14430 [Actinobacteria bacterium]|nr:hypothetical protein [Actinomycetota bacterium]